jgi:DNA polymerase
VELPSRRKLYYVSPVIVKNEWGGDCLSFMVQRGNLWHRERTWYGVLTENIVQAIARDCLTRTLWQAEARGLEVLFHVHDEVVCAGEPEQLDVLLGLMKAPVPWAEGLPLTAEGVTSQYYRKE